MLSELEFFPGQFGGGREWMWNEPAWKAVLSVLARHDEESFSVDGNTPVLEELVAALAAVEGAGSAAAAGDKRDALRASQVPWTETGVLDLAGRKIRVTDLGKRVVAGEATFADALRYLVIHHREGNGLSRFEPILRRLHEGQASDDDLFRAVQTAVGGEMAEWVDALALASFPFEAKPKDGPKRGVNLILRILRDAGLIISKSDGSDSWGHRRWSISDAEQASAVLGTFPDRKEQLSNQRVIPDSEGQIPEAISLIIDLLQAKKNVVLEGVPGTGKTHTVNLIAHSWHQATGRKLLVDDATGDPVWTLVMHPSTTYEDFVEGLRPGGRETPGGRFDLQVERGVAEAEGRAFSANSFGIASGFFKKVCRLAIDHRDRDVIVLLDEFNRSNVSSVLGDLLLLLEASKRALYKDSDWKSPYFVQLPYSRQRFFVPENVYVIATTNTTDRSVAPMDSAIRRRFAFYRLEPNFDSFVDPELVESAAMLKRLNKHVLEPCLGPDGLLGQSYLYCLEDSGGNPARVALAWRFEILPQLFDALRSHGAEDLLSNDRRDSWLATHPELKGLRDKILSALDDFGVFLDRLGLSVAATGTGLGRGLAAIGRASELAGPGEGEADDTGLFATPGDAADA